MSTSGRGVKQDLAMKRWFVVLLVGAAGVVALGLWEIATGRTMAGLGYIAVAVVDVIVVAAVHAHSRRSLNGPDANHSRRKS